MSKKKLLKLSEDNRDEHMSAAIDGDFTAMINMLEDIKVNIKDASPTTQMMFYRPIKRMITKACVEANHFSQQLNTSVRKV